MDENQTNATIQQPSEGKLPYRKPELVELGNVVEMTQGGAGSKGDLAGQRRG
jgi:hypothetical protein